MNHRTRKKAAGSNRSTKSRGKTAKEKSSCQPSSDAVHSSDGSLTATATWVDGLRFEPVGDDGSGHAAVVPAPSCSLGVLSWNVLADSYCRPNSQTHLPRDYKKKVFYGKHRRENVVRILERFALEERVDVICLQEVDIDEIKVALDECGYNSVETPRIVSGGGGAGGRVDSCSIFVRKETWKLADCEVIRLDDLSYLSSASSSHRHPSNLGNERTADDVANNESAASAHAYSNFQGLQQSFLRRNMAVLARVQHILTGQTVVVGNCHLYWHPAYEYLKLCQAHYVLLRARQFCRTGEPFVFCGDLNSKPFGAAHTYLARGLISAKRYAPWYRIYDEEGEEQVISNVWSDDGSELAERVRTLTLTNGSTPTGSPRYLLDATLNKLCRWMRILGLDTALETDEEEKRRTGEGKMILFERCRMEKRTLVTTSTRLQSRSDCPPGAYVINPTFLDKLEVVLVHILLTHGVVLEPVAFLSRCVICNGGIDLVQSSNDKIRILQEYEAPVDMLKEDMEVYQCDRCGQGYWWCDRPTSSASRVKGTATRLFQLCLRAGVQTHGPLSMMEHVNAEEERGQGWDYSQPGSELLDQKLDVLDWLRCDALKCPFRLESVYARRQGGEVVGELLPFTNVTHDFVNTLDYIFVSGLTIDERLAIPTALSQLNTKGFENGHLLPSDIWPSDHLLVGSRLSVPCQPLDSGLADTPARLPPQDIEHATSGVGSAPISTLSCSFLGNGEPPDMSQPSSQLPNASGHGSGCACGCVPSVPSLFEMAELRRKARLAKTTAESLS